MKSKAITGFLLVARFMSSAVGAKAQARQEVKYNIVPPQLTITYQHIDADYQFLQSDGSLKRVMLNGIAIEYAYRRFYPVEIISHVSSSAGNPLSQRLSTASAGVGYSREVAHRYDPFVRVTAGIARTSSSDMQYLFAASRNGLDLNVYGGLDVSVKRRWGVRAIEVQNQYLPYGVQGQGSVYWSIWLPYAIYIEEPVRGSVIHGQLRFWGYHLERLNLQRDSSMTNIQVDNALDESTLSSYVSPLEASNLWRKQAESNVLDRLESAGLIAPAGDFEKILDQIVIKAILREASYRLTC